MKATVAEDMSSTQITTLYPPGDVRTAFEREVLPLQAELTRAAIRLATNVPDAEDLVQDALLRAYRSYATFDPGTNVRAWMHQILRNVWISKHRTAQRRVTEVMNGELPESADRSAQSVSSEATFLAGQPDSEVVAAMADLSDDFRMVVYLADVEGHPYATIAEMMNTPLGTVMSRLHRARRQLRMALGGTVRRRRLVMAA